MGQPAILFYGTPQHTALGMIYRLLLSRKRYRVVFLTQECFPAEIGVYLTVGKGTEGGTLCPPKEAPIALEDLVSVCMDGYYVSPEGLQSFPPKDIEYIQTESWATLIALFSYLSRKILVANHVTKRDHLSSRLAELAFLSGKGLQVPRVLATSDPAAAREFFEFLSGKVIYKPISGKDLPFRAMNESDLDRLDALSLAPAHLEETPTGYLYRCVKAGRRIISLPRVDAPPADVLEKCQEAFRELDLHLAEITLRKIGDEWVASGIRPFLTPEVLLDPEVVGAVVSLLEGQSPPPDLPPQGGGIREKIPPQGGGIADEAPQGGGIADEAPQGGGR